MKREGRFRDENDELRAGVLAVLSRGGTPIDAITSDLHLERAAQEQREP